MNFYLESATKRISIKTERVFGREDFPENENLSRRHFEVTVNNGICLVKDLESRNGTFINGNQLKANKVYKLGPDDVIQAGDWEFTCHPGAPGIRAFKTQILSCSVIMAVLYVALINGTGMDHGRGIGLFNDLTLFAILAASVMLLAVGFKFVASNEYWSPKVAGLHVALVLFGAIFLNDALMGLANDTFQLGDNLANAKIEYYCTAHFHAPKCIDAIAYCPKCAHAMPVEIRHAILKRIQPFQQEVAALAAAQAKRQPASILPKVVK